MNELEIIQYSLLDGLQMFLDTVEYRTSHFHPEWELVWVLENPLAVAYRQKQYELQPGEMILFEPNEPHEFHRVEKESTFLCLQMSPGFLPKLANIAMDENTPHLFMAPGDFQKLKHRLLEMAMAYFGRTDQYELLCSGMGNLILYELLAALPHHVMSMESVAGIGKRNARLGRLIRFVDEHYMEKIRLEDFAARENCSATYLSRFIKKALNQTFREYVTSVRFHCACKLISEGRQSMLDVCMSSGFSDYRYFSRAFQENYHMTPEQYRHAKQPQPQAVRHSLHSIEQIYSREKSLKKLESYMKMIE